ncbi:hypothetical protein EVAR_59985_1 [Eumeta japonica]|uniref:Uncharacterized protein n=1 Tax=Eumeta variegata TaxID=151549 RepID=A0A4C1ZJ94_EUMVA|nr:hypothetical protein EVAR_59985_1 [Eumeta japonica]
MPRRRTLENQAERRRTPSNTAVVYQLPVYHSQTDDFSDLSQPTLEAPAAAQKKKTSDRKHFMNTMKR